MPPAGAVVLLASVAYLALLFAVASWGDRRGAAATAGGRGRGLVGGPYVYTLSLAVFCSAWTFHGSVGLAVAGGLAFLPVYLGPTLAALLFPAVLRKMIRAAKANGVGSIADLVGARYGKSAPLAGLVTVVAVLAAVPYISLQLKAVAAGVAVLALGGLAGDGGEAYPPGGGGAALLVTLLLAAFAILFGTRHVDATARHTGMVLAVALESLVKLAAFLLVGIFVTWGLFDGPAALFAAAAARPGGPPLTVAGPGLGYADWLLLTLVSGLAFLVLPRQFQVAVVENVDERHVDTAAWLLPLYLLAINLFVLPIALAGSVLMAGEGDLLVLRLPLLAGHERLALAAHLGGLSAATAMIIVESLALSTMISNDLVVPVLLRLRLLGQERRPDLRRLVLAVRRGAILGVLLLGYAFFRHVGGHDGQGLGLASTGLIAFGGVAQFAPPIVLGLYWRGAHRAGAAAGLLAGVGVWAYTLVLPTLAEAGLLDAGFVADGPFGIGLLRPRALLGLEGLDPTAHAVLWSLGANTVLLVLGSLLAPQGELDRLQAALFVGAGRRRAGAGRSGPAAPPATAEGEALRSLLARFLGGERAAAVLAGDEAGLVRRAERELGRAIGANSARIMVASVARGGGVRPGEVMAILDEASGVIERGRRLERESRALEEATAELRAAYERLRELDRLKDEFVATVSHELRTPLTSIRSFSEILLDTPDLTDEERRRFLGVVVKEADRLGRLVDDVLDLARIESGRMDWRIEDCDLREVVEESLAASGGVAAERELAVEADLGSAPAVVRADRDRLVQVAVNLLANAAKFAPAGGGGRIRVSIGRGAGGSFTVRVEDNGPGVPEARRGAVFERFRQVGGGDVMKDKPKGTGLGLTISRQIVERFGGRIWLEGSDLGGAAACFALPAAAAGPAGAARPAQAAGRVPPAA